MKTLTPRELEIKRVQLAMLKTDIDIEVARAVIAAMQRKQAARRKEIARQMRLMKKENK